MDPVQALWEHTGPGWGPGGFQLSSHLTCSCGSPRGPAVLCMHQTRPVCGPGWAQGRKAAETQAAAGAEPRV